MSTSTPTLAELVAQNTAATAMNSKHLDAMWMLLAGVLVFFMQAGFCMLEAGCVRRKNVTSIMVKNLVDACCAALGWTMLGYGIAFPDSGEAFMTDKKLRDQEKDFFFQFTFNATAATIVSGALAERARLEGYMLFTLVMTVFIYPMVVRFTWGGGFLYTEGYSDFAGSGIVHMCGGVSALVGAIICGPRKGRFDGTDEERAAFAPSSMANVCLGTLILWVGWYGFNAGSTLGMSSDPAGMAAGDITTYMSAGRCAMTTTCAAAAGGVTAFILLSARNHYYDVMGFCNGVLAGLVGVTAGTGSLDSWSAMIAGAVGAAVMVGATVLLERLRVDDVIGAFPVHGAAGAWGVLAEGLFNMDSGLFMGGGGDLLVKQLLGIAVIAGWTAGCSIVLFGTLRVTGLLRVSPEIEAAGLDSECGASPAPQMAKTKTDPVEA